MGILDDSFPSNDMKAEVSVLSLLHVLVGLGGRPFVAGQNNGTSPITVVWNPPLMTTFGSRNPFHG
jgi:hypothetical protein